jgi:hypothetical protein
MQIDENNSGMGNAAVARWAACLLQIGVTRSKVGSEGLGQAGQEQGSERRRGWNRKSQRERWLVREVVVLGCCFLCCSSMQRRCDAVKRLKRQ